MKAQYERQHKILSFLQEEDKDMFVEFGAGKGYLSSCLCDLQPASSQFVLVDNQSFSCKAERYVLFLPLTSLNQRKSVFKPKTSGHP